MAKDPAFLFYPGDASEDTQFMNRLERGCYFDLLKAQKRFGKFTLAQIKKVLGADFSACWPAIELILKKEGEFYSIEWIDTSIDRRKKHAAKQKEKIEAYWRRKKLLESGNTNELPNTYQTEEMVKPLVNEIENGNGNGNENKGGVGEWKVDYPFSSPEFTSLWVQWKNYCKSIKKPYQTFSSEQAALQYLGKYDEPTASEMINQAMRNNWKNLRELEHKQTNHKNGNPTLKKVTPGGFGQL